MCRRFLVSFVVVGMTVVLAGTGLAQAPTAPPVPQTLGMPDVVAGDLEETDCRVCHDAAQGVPDRHHLLWGQPIPPGSHVPFPDADNDGTDDANYGCLNCHDPDFNVVRDCTACHTSSPHHVTPDAVALNCKACHGDFVDNPDDGHYIPTYDPSLVTPWRGLNGDGWENGTPDMISDGSGDVVRSDIKAYGPFGTVSTRSEPNKLWFKPAGDHNDFVIQHGGHDGDTYHVVFAAMAVNDPVPGRGVTAAWNDSEKLLTITVDFAFTAQQLVTAVNDLGVEVEAQLGYDGDTAYPPEHYEPIGAEPLNNRGFGAGSCSYCHDNDGNVDANGDPVGPIWDNHTLHHEIHLDLGFPARCNLCHDFFTTSQQSGPNFDSAIRICEKCHGPDSLHNIQADSPNANNVGTVVVGGEDAGYGHVGRDAGPGDSDCWGCHGFAVATAPRSGPLVPSINSLDRTVITAGSDTTVRLTGAAFTNTAGGTTFESDLMLTGPDGSSLTLTPDAITDAAIQVTIPADVAPGSYAMQAIKVDEANDNAEVKSNPAVISIVPKVTIDALTSDGTVTIKGSGFGGYGKGSGTSVTRARSWGWGRWARTTAVEGKIVSWNDTEIVADFGSAPKEVTVNSVFGKATSKATSSKADDVATASSATALFGSATTKSKTSKAAGSSKARKRTRGGWWW